VMSDEIMRSHRSEVTAKSQNRYSPIILTSTRLRRLPSNSP
jgi:hypothetical protein